MFKCPECEDEFVKEESFVSHQVMHAIEDLTKTIKEESADWYNKMFPKE